MFCVGDFHTVVSLSVLCFVLSNSGSMVCVSWYWFLSYNVICERKNKGDLPEKQT